MVFAAAVVSPSWEEEETEEEEVEGIFSAIIIIS